MAIAGEGMRSSSGATRCRRPSARPPSGGASPLVAPLSAATRRRPRFRVLVSPLVTWIWLGALVVFAGGLIALWPAPAGRPAPATRGVRGASRPGAQPRLRRADRGRRMEVLIVVVAVVVRRGGDRRARCGPARGRGGRPAGSPERAELEAAKEAKYREIREAELDYRTGKLSREDWRALDCGAEGRGDRAAAPPRRARPIRLTRGSPRSFHTARQTVGGLASFDPSWHAARHAQPVWPD